MSNDNELQQAVLAELNWEPSISAAHIGVSANTGVVTLTGHVDSFLQKHSAQQASLRVKGVKAVADEIEVQLPFDLEKTDDEIASAAVDRLWWDVSVPRDAIKVSVDKGWVTLTGQVDWYYQKSAAEDDIRRLFGVVGLSNQTTLRPKVDVPHIRNNIEHALRRAWFFDEGNLTVSADGGTVRLGGTVHSLHDRQAVESTAWAAPGVTDVIDEISIT